MRRALPIVLLLLAACSRQDDRGAFPPVPGDWTLIAPEARPVIEQAIEQCRKNPHDPAALEKLGRLYHANGAPRLAAAAYERAGTDDRTLYLLGLIREEMGETEAALALFRRVREPRGAMSAEKPESRGYAPLEYHVGSVLLESSRAAESIASFREAVRLDPHEPAFRVGLARALRQTGALTEALAVVQEALKRAPDHPGANQVAALILKEQGRADAAIPHLAKARTYHAEVIRDPWFLEVQKLGATVAGSLAQAEFFLENKNAYTAREYLRPLAKAHPERADVHRLLARTYAIDGMLPLAKESYARAVELAPGDARTHADLSSVLLDLGELDAAASHASTAIAADPDLLDARVVRAAVKFRKGDPRAALEELDPVLKVRPDLLLALVVRGDALLALGRRGEAVQAYQAALAVNPNLAYVKARLGEAGAATRGAESR